MNPLAERANREPGQGLDGREPGPPSPMDTHAGVQKEMRREPPSKHGKTSLRGKGSCRRARKAAFEAAAGRAREWAGAVYSPPSGLTGNPMPLTSWMKIRLGFPILGRPCPTQSRQLDLSQNGISFCQLPFRTIKTKSSAASSLRLCSKQAGSSSHALPAFFLPRGSPFKAAQLLASVSGT